MDSLEDLPPSSLQATIIGRKQNQDNTNFLFIIQLQFRNQVGRVMRSYEEFDNLSNQLTNFLPRIPYVDKEELPNMGYKFIDNLQERLNSFMDVDSRLMERMDVVSSQQFQDFLILEQFKDLELTICNPPKMLRQIYYNQPDYKITHFTYIEEIGLIICAHEDYSDLDKLGIVWNLIEREQYGLVTLWLRYTEPDSEIPNFKLALAKLFDNKVSTFAFLISTSMLYLGLENGHMLITKCAPDSEMKYSIEIISCVKLFLNRILGLEELTSNILVGIAADNHLKIFDTTQTKLIGGGSLNNRLEGDFLNILAVEKDYNRVYMGTKSSKIIVYSISKENCAPKYNTTLITKIKNSPINALRILKGNLFVGQKNCVIVYALSGSSNPSQTAIFNTEKFTGPEYLIEDETIITEVYYCPTKQVIIAGTQSGIILVWNSRTGELLSAKNGFHSSITRFLYLPTNSILVSSSSTSKIKFFMIYEQEKIIVPHTEGLICNSESSEADVEKLDS